MSVALCWLAAGIWLAARTAPRAGRRRHGGELSPTALRFIVAGACIVAAVAAFGPGVGAAVTVLIAPPLVLLVGHLHGRRRRGLPDDASRVPLLLDLLAAALRSGQPISSALTAAAPLAGARLGAQLCQVGGLLRLGADPAQAWASLTDPALAPVASTARRSAESGVRLARGFELLADELRADARAAAVVRAQRAGVWAVAPLGLCFLPAFACLGIVPVIVSIAHGVLNQAMP
jgi:pilus assembly protein TadC